MSLDLEDRLRTMYAAVAATTELEAPEPDLVDLTAPPASLTMHRVRVVALVAAAAVVAISPRTIKARILMARNCHSLICETIVRIADLLKVGAVAF